MNPGTPASPPTLLTVMRGRWVWVVIPHWLTFPSSPTGLGPSLLSLYPDEDTVEPRSHFQPAVGLAQAN